MIEVYSDNVTVPTATAIPLENVGLKKGCSVVNTGTRTLQFNKPGIYRVDLDADATSETATSGDIIVQLMLNGILKADAKSQETVASTTASHSLAFSTLVIVPCNCQTPLIAVVQNVGVDAVYNHINVVVTKVC